MLKIKPGQMLEVTTVAEADAIDQARIARAYQEREAEQARYVAGKVERPLAQKRFGKAQQMGPVFDLMGHDLKTAKARGAKHLSIAADAAREASKRQVEAQRYIDTLPSLKDLVL